MLMHLGCCEPSTRIESWCSAQLNRHPALGTLNDRINIEGSGEAEWLRRTKPNNSFNASGNRVAFMRDLALMMLYAAALIRALGGFLFL
jgi:hypothetical protein